VALLTASAVPRAPCPGTRSALGNPRAVRPHRRRVAWGCLLLSGFI